MKLLLDIFDNKLDSESFTNSHDVIFKMASKTLSSTCSAWPLYFTMRYDFDAMLVDLAQKAGAVLKSGSELSDLDISQRRVRLQSGEELKYRFLVAADGVNSQIAKKLFGEAFDRDSIGFGLEIEVPIDQIPTRENTVEIEFDAARWGYGWVFPKRSGYTIGVGGLHTLNPDLRDRLNRFVELRGVNVSQFRVKGQYIPFGDFRSRPNYDSIFFCGDAAGLVDPITGEGISYALESGAAIGRAIARDVLSGGTEKADRLYAASYKKLVHSICQASFWRNLIFPHFIQRSFAYTFADASTLQQAYLNILAGEQNYDDLYRTFLIQAGKAGRKLAKKLAYKVGVGGPVT